MVATHAIEPVSTGSTNLMDYRYRPAMGERTVLPDSTQKSGGAAQPGGDRRLPHEKRAHGEEDQLPPEPSRSGASDFAAAVIAGALPPRPQSLEELFRRIGAAEIPQESMARLKDFMA